MKRLLFIGLLVLSCQKDPAPDPNQPCFMDGWGQIRVQNFTDDRHKFFFNTTPMLTVTVDGNGTVDVNNIAAGIYKVRWTNERTNGVGEINDFEVKVCDIVLLPIIF